jgi:hypothetical protein
MATTYTTRGAVRGCCGHNHQTIKAAYQCVMKDRSLCSQKRRESDRYVCRADGNAFTEIEMDQFKVAVCAYLLSPSAQLTR